ncbi:MAG: hypothetical protein ISR58_17735 [Anaerolineales bacterium]|nr:hypothetical protein [Anaerolineales bacterium]
MGWEYRNGQKYYYRKHRIGKRVFSEYIGKGFYAEMAADQDAMEREEARLKKEKILLLIEESDEVDNLIEDFDEFCKFTKNAMLINSGFRLHNGEWRKRRYG